jgi:hypothetical protein
MPSLASLAAKTAMADPALLTRNARLTAAVAAIAILVVALAAALIAHAVR